MIHALDLRESMLYCRGVSKVVLSCDTELEKEVFVENLFGTHRLDVPTYPSSGDYKQMSNDEIRDYIRGYYENVLSKLDPEEVAGKLRFSQFVSDERTDSLAKRHIISEWLELYTGDKVYESGIDTDEVGGVKYVKLERPEFIGPMLEEIIKSSKETMRGFQSLRALYLFEKGEKLEALADRLEAKNNLDYCDYRSEAASYRCLADDVEEEYKKERDKAKTKNYSSQRKYVMTSR